MRAWWWLLVVGCGDPCVFKEPANTTLRFADPTEALTDFVAHPWPSDGLRRPNGRLRVDHFPNTTESSTLQDYLSVFGRELTGFANSGAIYLGFTGPLAPPQLSPAATLDPLASIQLVDIDPRSPERGRRYPLRIRYQAEPSLYLPAHTLQLLPLYGATLRSGTTYAVLLNRGFNAEDGPAEPPARLQAALDERCEEAAGGVFGAFAFLRDYLEVQAIDSESIVGATVFTTQDPLVEIRQLGAAARAFGAPQVSNWGRAAASSAAFRFLAETQLPGYQAGALPFRTIDDGGAFKRGPNGFEVDHLQTTRLGLSIPKSAMPPGGYPVVLYSPGTGGDHTSAFEAAVGDALAAQGIAVLSYDPTLHGPRDPTGSDPSLTFFNLFNPVGARDNVRQGAADGVVLASLLEVLRIPAELTGGRGELFFDTQKMVFLGHSQGSLVGAPLAAVEPRFKAMVFSGLGAILNITLQERKDIVNFAELLRSLLAFPEAEILDDFHPVLNLIQTFIEPADPIGYARSYLVDPPQGVRRDFLMVEGFLDFASPARGQEAFATAAGFPIVAPVHRVPEAMEVLGPAPVLNTARENVSSAAGQVTAGLIQYPNETHFPIFDNSDAQRRYLEFIVSVINQGRGEISLGE